MAGARLNEIEKISNNGSPSSAADFRQIIEKKIAELRTRKAQLPASDHDEMIQEALSTAETNLAALNDSNLNQNSIQIIIQAVNSTIDIVNQIVLSRPASPSSLPINPPAPEPDNIPVPNFPLKSASSVLGATPISVPPAAPAEPGIAPISVPSQAPDAMPVPNSSAPAKAQSPAPAKELPLAPAPDDRVPVSTPGSFPPPPPPPKADLARTQAAAQANNIPVLPENAPEWLKRITADLKAAANEVTNAQKDADIIAAHQKMAEVKNEYDQLTKDSVVQNKITNDVNSINHVGLDKIEKNLALIWGKIGLNEDLVDLSALTSYANQCDQIRQRLESYVAHANGYGQPAGAAAQPANIQKVKDLLKASNSILKELRPKLERAADNILHVQHYSNRAEILPSDMAEDKVQSIISKNASTQAQLAAHVLPRNISTDSARVSTIVARKADNLMDDGAPKSFNVCTVEKFSEGRIISEFHVNQDEIKKLEKVASGNSFFASNEKKIRAQKEMLKIAITIIENIRAINPDLKVAIRMEGDYPRGLVNAMMYYCEIQKSKGELGYNYLNLTQHQLVIKEHREMIPAQGGAQPKVKITYPGLDVAEEHIAQVQAQIFKDKAGKEGLISRTEEATIKSDMNFEEPSNKRPRF